jgi:hypothetical protein
MQVIKAYQVITELLAQMEQQVQVVPGVQVVQVAQQV